MKNITKKILSLLTACMLVLSAIPVMALGTAEASSSEYGTLTVDSVLVRGAEQFTLNVTLENNPGICSMGITPEYDTSVLKLESMKVGAAPWNNAVIGSSYIWTNMAGDITNDGLVLSMTFSVIDTESIVDTEVSVVYDGSNYNEETPKIEVVSGQVTVIPENTGTITVGGGNYLTGETVEIPVVLEDNPGMCAMTIAPVYDSSVFELVDIKAGEGSFANAVIAAKYVWANMAGDTTQNGVILTLVFKVLDTAPHGDTTVSVVYNGSNESEKTPAIFPISGKSTIHNAEDIVTDAAVAATCTEDGLTEGSHCSVCGEILVAQQTIPTTGHDFETEFTIDLEATATAPGQKSRHCRNCTAITDITEIPIYVKGDINTDGSINTKDLTRLMRLIAGYDMEIFEYDLTGDGKSDTKDLTRLMKYIAGFDVEFA